MQLPLVLLDESKAVLKSQRLTHKVWRSSPAGVIGIFLIHFHLILFRTEVQKSKHLVWLQTVRQQRHMSTNHQRLKKPKFPKHSNFCHSVHVCFVQHGAIQCPAEVRILSASKPGLRHSSWESLKHFWSHLEITFWMKEFPVANCGLLRISWMWPHTSIILLSFTTPFASPQ